MAAVSINRDQANVPTYVLDLDEVAIAAGLRVSRSFEEVKSYGEDNPYQMIYTTWTGPESAFRATGLFSGKFKFRNSSNLHHGYIRFGDMTIGDEISLTQGDEQPVSIEQGDVQAYLYPPSRLYEKRAGYYGNAENLIGAEIFPAALLPNSRSFRRNDWVQWRDARVHFDIYKLPNGKLFVGVDQERGEPKKEEEPSYSCAASYLAALAGQIGDFTNAALTYFSERAGWRLVEGDRQRIVELTVQLRSAILNAKALPTKAPVLRLVK